MKIRMTVQIFALLCAMLLGLARSGAAVTVNLVKNGDFAGGREGWIMVANDYGEVAPMDTADARSGFRKVMRASIKQVEDNKPFLVKMGQKLDFPLKDGETLTIKLWLRSSQSLKIGVALEQTAEAHGRLSNQVLTLTPEWKEYQVTAKPDQRYQAGEVALIFNMGYETGTIDLAGVRVLAERGRLPDETAAYNAAAYSTAPIGPSSGAAPPVKPPTPVTPPVTPPVKPPTPVTPPVKPPTPVTPVTPPVKPPTPPVTPPTPGTPTPGTQGAANLLQNGDFAQNAANWEGAEDSSRGKASFVDVQAGTFRRALRVVSSPGTSDKPWTVSLRQILGAPLKKGAKFVVRCWLRAPDGGKIGVVVEQSKAPFTKLLDKQLRLTPQWTEYEIEGNAASDFATGTVRLSLYLSLEPLTVEIAGLRLTNGDSPSPNAPVSVTPPVNAVLTLDAESAKVFGVSARLEKKPGGYNIGLWSNLNDVLRWTADVPRPGVYLVEMTYAAENFSGGGSEMELVAGNQALVFQPTATASWETYETAVLGEVKIDKTGATPLYLMATKKPKPYVVNIRSLTLTLTGAPALPVTPRPPTRAPQDVLFGLPLRAKLPEGTFEELDAKNQPVGWSLPEKMQVIEENGNHFLRVVSDTPTEFLSTVIRFKLDPAWRALKMSVRLRAKNLQRKDGAQAWETARVAINFLNEDSESVPGFPPSASLQTDSDWTTKVIQIKIPDGAVSLTVSPLLHNTAGIFDVDDLTLEAAQP